MRKKASYWHVYRIRGNLLAADIYVKVRPNQQKKLVERLQAILQSDRHTFLGTVARYVIKSDEALTRIHIMLVWKDIEMPDDATLRKGLVAFSGGTG